MKNWQRLKNHYGKRDMWIYETESGESKYVECDEDGWIAVDVLLPVKANEVMTCHYDDWLQICKYYPHQSRWSDGAAVVAWQPLPNPYKPKLQEVA